MACPHTSSDDCPLCAATLDGDSSGDTLVRDAATGPVDSLTPGAPIGRYAVLDRLGHGGMGVVYTAHDPQLQRVVAIKVLRSRPDKDASQTTGQQRLLREAQAMAQLSHPNVVPVYDSGPFGEGVFIAMELVRGSTLDLWVKLKPRRWREVLAVFVMAGRGLEAAHAAGLVHRDFKPANVLMGTDGRPRVTDFGLARATRSLSLPEVAETPDSVSRPGPLSLEEPLTLAGAMMGSPGYMAPEQYAAAETTAATDQFAFCVSLYEALYGVRPYVAKTLPELELVTSRGEVPPPPKGSEVPSWLHRILVKGLSPAPEKRHASMTVLLAALSNDPALARRRWGAIAAGVGVLLLAGGLTAWSSWRQARACRGADELLRGVWDEAVKQRSSAAFVATGAPFARTSWVLTRDALDTWTKQWTAARTEACEATRVRGEQTERQLLLRFECLDRRLAEMGALAEAFGTADASLVAKAGTATSKLSPLSSCANLKQLEDRRAPPPELAVTAQQLAQELAQGRALLAAGRLADARARVAASLGRARELNLVALESEGLEAMGDLETQSRNFRESRRNFEEALRAAEAAGDDAAAARILSLLTSVVGWRMDRPDEARTWAALASGKLQRIGGDRLIEAYLAEGLGDAEWQAGRRAVSLTEYRKSLALYREEQGPESVDVARLHSAVGWVLTEQGELARAREELERSRDIRERLLGRDHPALAATWNELAALALEQRDTREAVRCARLTMQLTPDAKQQFKSRLTAATILVYDGQAQEGLAELELLRAEFETWPDEQAGALAEIQRGHVLALTRLSRAKEALVEGRAWLAESTRRWGRAHPDVATLADAVGEAAFASGLWAEAAEDSEQYLAMKATLGGADSPLTGATLLRSARAHLALGKAAEALPRAERALVALEKGTLDDRTRADAQLTLAEALTRTGGAKDRAASLLAQAKEAAQAARDEALLARVTALAELVK